MLCVFKRRGYSEGEGRWGGVSQNEVVGLGFSPHVADLSGDCQQVQVGTRAG